jgi:hypothetical protein
LVAWMWVKLFLKCCKRLPSARQIGQKPDLCNSVSWCYCGRTEENYLMGSKKANFRIFRRVSMIPKYNGMNRCLFLKLICHILQILILLSFPLNCSLGRDFVINDHPKNLTSSCECLQTIPKWAMLATIIPLK